MELAVLDIGLRGIATGMTLICVVVVATDRVTTEAKLALILASIATIARMWGDLPKEFEIQEPALFFLRLIGCFGALGVTWLVLTFFLDRKRYTWLWLGSALVLSLGIVSAFVLRDIVPYLRGYAVLHFLALLALVLGSAKGDLSDERRSMRPAMSIFVLVFCIGRALTSTQLTGPATIYVGLFQSTAISGFAFVFTVWALRANMKRWPTPTPTLGPADPRISQAEGAQKALITRIDKVMAEGIWLREGLTVAALAQEVGAPEHRVRKAINQVLGHRNFASFINSARVRAAMIRLQSPEDADTTILEIAYSVGFASLGPFNRSFRDVVGQSPTEYRASATP